MTPIMSSGKESSSNRVIGCTATSSIRLGGKTQFSMMMLVENNEVVHFSSMTAIDNSYEGLELTEVVVH